MTEREQVLDLQLLLILNLGRWWDRIKKNVWLKKRNKNQVDDRDGNSDDEAERSGSENEPEAPAELELEDHVFKVNQQGTVGKHQVVKLKHLT